jgi:hypothetical protein
MTTERCAWAARSSVVSRFAAHHSTRAARTLESRWPSAPIPDFSPPSSWSALLRAYILAHSFSISSGDVRSSCMTSILDSCVALPGRGRLAHLCHLVTLGRKARTFVAVTTATVTRFLAEDFPMTAVWPNHPLQQTESSLREPFCSWRLFVFCRLRFLGYLLLVFRDKRLSALISGLNLCVFALNPPQAFQTPPRHPSPQ